MDIAKTVLYGYIKLKYGWRATLCYTDSLILHVFADNIYEDIKENIDYFDISNYKINNIHSIPKTISVVGEMKDEYAGIVLERFYGIGAKAYCVKADEVMKKAKGISKNVVKNQLHFKDYVQIVEEGKTIYHKMYIFKSNLHNLHPVEEQSCFITKR